MQSGDDFAYIHYFGEDEARLLRDSNKNGGYVPFDVVMRQFGTQKPAATVRQPNFDLEITIEIATARIDGLLF